MTSKGFDIREVENLLTSPEQSVVLLPVSSIRESDHAFFWGAFFLAIATCLFGCAAALYATAYSHMPFIFMIEGFGTMFLIFFAAFVSRGLQIRRKSRAHERRRFSGEIVYSDKADGRYAEGAGFSMLQESINRELGDGAARTREEVIGILSRMSTEEVDVGTLNQVVNTLVESGMFTETESNGRKLLTFSGQKGRDM
ncbi:MAG: hypothetical protein K9J79_09440 [Desulfobacteraceae bacterium]|nr:hypothetical protein [Desulfobacteraceae bacterium]